MAKIKEINGNIFNSSSQVLVNTVNCEGFMGKGIALEFKNRFPEMFIEYKHICDKNNLKPGLLHLHTKSQPWILNFPTKYLWRYPSQIEFIEDGLKKFVRSYQEKKITSIAFPELGTSYGGLQWQDVRDLMYKYLEPLENLEVEIYHFDPRAKDPLFDYFCNITKKFERTDYKKFLKLTDKQTQNLQQSLDRKMIQSMLDLQKMPGFGERTIDNIYTFLRDTESHAVIKKNRGKQPKLFN